MAGILFNSSGRVFVAAGLALAGCAYKQAVKCSDSSATTLYLQEAKIPASGFIKRTSDGLCYSFGSTCYACLPGGGTDLAGDFTSVTGCDDAGCGGIAACDIDETVCCLKIDSYVDGMFTACSACANSSIHPWDGKFIDDRLGPNNGYIGTWWVPSGNYCGRTSGGAAASISGKIFDINDPALGPITAITYDPSVNPSIQCYRLKIICEDPDFIPTDYHVIWEGVKGGSSPIGVYNRIGGCDTTSAVSIVAC